MDYEQGWQEYRMESPLSIMPVRSSAIILISDLQAIPQRTLCLGTRKPERLLSIGLAPSTYDLSWANLSQGHGARL